MKAPRIGWSTTLDAAQPIARLDRSLVQPPEVAAHSLDHGAEIEGARRDDVLGRLPAFGENPQPDQRESVEALPGRLAGGDRRVLLEAPLEPFRGAEVCALQVLDDFDDGPLIGIAAGGTFGAAAAGGVFHDVEALLEVSMHGGQL